MTHKRNKNGYIRGFHVSIERDDAKLLHPEYRAELWWNPYDGVMVAATRWVGTKQTASRDRKRYLEPFLKTQQESRR